MVRCTKYIKRILYNTHWSTCRARSSPSRSFRIRSFTQTSRTLFLISGTMTAIRKLFFKCPQSAIQDLAPLNKVCEPPHSLCAYSTTAHLSVQHATQSLSDFMVAATSCRLQEPDLSLVCWKVRHRRVTPVLVHRSPPRYRRHNFQDDGCRWRCRDVSALFWRGHT